MRRTPGLRIGLIKLLSQESKSRGRLYTHPSGYHYKKETYARVHTHPVVSRVVCWAMLDTLTAVPGSSSIIGGWFSWVAECALLFFSHKELPERCLALCIPLQSNAPIFSHSSSYLDYAVIQRCLCYLEI